MCSVLLDIKSLHVTYEYQLSAQQLTQQMVGEYLWFTISAKNQTYDSTSNFTVVNIGLLTKQPT